METCLQPVAALRQHPSGRGRLAYPDTPLDMSERSTSGRFHQSNAVLIEVRLGDGATVGIEVTVWRRISNPSLLYVSTRPEGGTWRTLNTPLDMSSLSGTRRFHQSNPLLVDVPLPDRPQEATVPADRSQCTIDEATAARVIASTVPGRHTQRTGKCLLHRQLGVRHSCSRGRGQPAMDHAPQHRLLCFGSP